jgi:hypothetical protein
VCVFIGVSVRVVSASDVLGKSKKINRIDGRFRRDRYRSSSSPPIHGDAEMECPGDRKDVFCPQQLETAHRRLPPPPRSPATMSTALTSTTPTSARTSSIHHIQLLGAATTSPPRRRRRRVSDKAAAQRQETELVPLAAEEYQGTKQVHALGQKRFVLAAKTGFCWRTRHPPATLSQ